MKTEDGVWKEPTKEESIYGKATKENLKVQRIRRLFSEFKMDGNPFVTSVPTYMAINLIDLTPNYLRVRKQN